ncbi:unnamed protein product, partial [Sphagnum compactum]
TAVANIPKDFLLTSKTRTIHRFWSPFIKRQVLSLEEARELRAGYLSGLLGRLIATFSTHQPMWLRVVECVAALDSLYAIHIFNSTRLGDIKAGSSAQGPSPAFVRNDIMLGGIDSPVCMLLTGPNMGGKSTLLRQVGTSVILAQLGTMLPAKALRLSIVDRIFARMGAQDDLRAGKSTFRVELEEASTVLREATHRSLVLMDELGRGTSTRDGKAIAGSVLYSLVKNIGCLSLFSTHYADLAQSLHIPQIGQYHLSCLVDQETRSVVFLFKLEQGICPRSYGMHVAAMAGIPIQTVERAQ